jgi:molybdopterin-guanine dinucleotide biosynthesis protein A
VNFSAVLLAGGVSRRMGRDKPALTWSGATLLVHQTHVLRRTGAAQLLLSRRPGQAWLVEGFELVTDSELDAGPAAALADVWRATHAPVLLALAVDLPQMPSEYLREMAVGALQQERSVVPMLAGRYEPMAAAWHRSCLPDFFNAAGRSLQSICATLAKRDLLTPREVSDGEAHLFENLNTPEDYERLGNGIIPAG